MTVEENINENIIASLDNFMSRYNIKSDLLQLQLVSNPNDTCEYSNVKVLAKSDKIIVVILDASCYSFYNKELDVDKNSIYVIHCDNYKLVKDKASDKYYKIAPVRVYNRVPLRKTKKQKEIEQTLAEHKQREYDKYVKEYRLEEKPKPTNIIYLNKYREGD